jgi:hypothetical protein
LSPDELRRLAEEATPGPWHWWDEGYLANGSLKSKHGLILKLRPVEAVEPCVEPKGANARLIALAPDLARVLADAAQIIEVFQHEEPDLMTADLKDWQERFRGLDAN